MSGTPAAPRPEAPAVNDGGATDASTNGHRAASSSASDDELDWGGPTVPSSKSSGGSTGGDAPPLNATEETTAAGPLEPAIDAAVGTAPDEPSAQEKTTGDDDDLEDTEEPKPVAARLPIVAHIFGQTDVGQIREHNEDNFLIANLGKATRGLEASETQEWKLDNGGILLAVCDGMGGAAAGEVASQMATDIIFEHMRKAEGHGDRDRLALDVVKALEEAGSSILGHAMANRSCRGMGTTATVAALVDDHLLLGQVGDSRAYIYRNSRLVQVTRDQSLVNQLIEAGQLTEEEAENFEHSIIILQALGTADSVQVDLTYVELRRGDVLMMCSDGLSGMLRDPEIRDLLRTNPDPAAACRVLLEEGNLAGGHDNITVITVRFDGEGLAECDDDATAALKYQKYPIPNSTSDDDESNAGPRTSAYDEAPSIEVHGEFEVDGDIDWDQLLHDRRMMPGEPQLEASRTWMWAVLAGAMVLGYYWFLR